MSKNKRKICIVVNSRANYGRIKSVLKAVNEHPNLELQLILGASAILERYGNIENIVKKDGFKPIANINNVIDGDTPSTMAKSTGLGILELSSILEIIKPDIALTVADRYETIATAIAASYMNIVVAHTQGGEITGSIDENVRHAVTKLSHIHLVATDRAKQFLVKMGENDKSIYLTGCPAIDLLKDIEKASLKDSLYKYKGVGSKINIEKPYAIVMQHPVTTEYKNAASQISETIKAVNDVSENGMQIIWLWPNVDAGSDIVAKTIRIYINNNNPQNISFYKNFSPEDYAVILNNSKCIIGNSSSGLREGAYLGVPCVNIGSRQRGRERAKNVIDVDYNSDLIKDAIKYQVAHGKYDRSHLVGDGKAGLKIAKILAKADLNINKTINYIK